MVPYEFARDLQRGKPVDVQVLLNAANANTATIAQGYAEGVIQSYNQTLATEGVRPRDSRDGGSTGPPPDRRGVVQHHDRVPIQPGLVNAWFIVTGTFGVLLILNGSLVASTAMIKEREAGTVEQLLMTPASTTDIVIAKITPLFVLLMVMVMLAHGRHEVHFPFRCAAACCCWC